MLFFTVTARAQPLTGRKYKLNALVNMDWQTYEPEDADERDVEKFIAKLGMGYFFNEMFEVGPELTYQKNTYENEVNTETSSYSLGIKGNVHFNIGGLAVPYFGVNIAYGSLKVEIDEFDEFDDDGTSLTYGAQVGMDYFVTERMSINPELQYTVGTYDFDEGDLDVKGTIFIIGIAGHF